MNSSQLINIVDVICHSFRHVDPRLINHGERVSYILMKMLADTSYYTKQEKQDIFMLGLLHDIGAYQEDEIDSMLSFDMNDPLAHSVFGYLLFQNFSPLPEYADVILYHHHCNAQYYPVPIGNYHRDIARLIYLADRIDIFCVLNDTQQLNSFLDSGSYTVFSDSNIRWFRSADEKYHILDNIRTGAYQQELTAYTRNQITLSEAQIHDYLMMFIFSVDFRNEYTALHTSYAVHLSEQFADTLHLSSISGRTIQLAAILHNIGKISLSSHVENISDYDRYLKELYQNSTLDVTRKILKDTVDPQIIKIIDESFLLLECWSEDEAVSFTPAPAAEIVALSYLISNVLTHNTDFTYHAKLFTFLKRRYQSCHMDDAILLALEKYFRQIMEKTFDSCSSVFHSYHHMMDEKHFLNNILLHYNSKYQ
ncbi:HD domain-containing protein [Lachnospiraceae bacterium KK002]